MRRDSRAFSRVGRSVWEECQLRCFVCLVVWVLVSSVSDEEIGIDSNVFIQGKFRYGCIQRCLR